MSSIMLIASNRSLKEIPYPPGYTIRIDAHNGIIDDGDMDDGFSIFPMKRVLEIPSQKAYFAGLQWHYTPGRAKKIIEYLEEHLKTAEEIELWHIWQDMDFGHKIRKATIPINELSVNDIQELDQLEVWKEPVTDYCYVVTKATD